MKTIILSIFLLSSFLFASDKALESESEKKARIENRIKKEIEREKEYAEKQTFYIDLEGAEVNEESLKDVPTLEIDDFDMDSVYN